MSNTITITGRAVADATLKFTPSGKAVAQFRIADDYGSKDQSGQWQKKGTTYLTVDVWDHLAEECAEKVRKGVLVSVTGQLQQRDFEHNGEKRSSFEVRNVSQVAIPLPRFKPKGEQPGDGRYQRPSQQQDDPWGSAPAGGAFGGSDNTDPPF